jgi:GTP-binding protein EngB required for normal cell division
VNTTGIYMAVTQEYKFAEHVERLKRICRDFHIDSLKPQMHAVSETLLENRSINVALLGRFKAGKSSFINSIIGKNIMPVAVLPLTSVITYVRYGPQSKAEVNFTDGRSRAIDLSELADYITEERNPKNLKDVVRVDVELSNLQGYANIQFVDTPGLGSIFKHNTLTSRDWLPRVGAALLAVSVDHPLSEEDISLLKELDAHTCEIVILLTKVDLVSSQEAGQITEFIKAQVKGHLNKDLQVLAFSNKPGYERVREAIIQFLQQSLEAQSSQKSKEILRHKLSGLVTKCHEYLSLGLSAANSSQEARADLIHHIQKERDSLSTIQNEIRLVTNGLKKELQADSSQIFENQRSTASKELLQQLKENMRQWKGNLEKTSQAFRQWTESNLTAELQPISEKYGLQLKERHLKTCLGSYMRAVRAFQDRLALAIEKALHIQFPGAKFEIHLQQPKKPSIYIGNVFMTPWEIISFLIPMRLFRPLVNGHFVNRLPDDVAVNLSRIARQWTEAISASIDNAEQQARAFIQNEIATIENLLDKAPDKRAEIEKAILELDAIKTEIHS